MLNRKGTDYFLNQTEMTSKREIKTMEQKILMLNNEISGKKRDWEEERCGLIERIGGLERDCATQKVNLSNAREKIDYLKEEKEKLEKNLREITQESKQRELELEQTYKSKLDKVEQKLDSHTTNNTQTIVQLEKENALLKQEVEFSRKEIYTTSERLQLQERELLKLRAEIGQYEKYLEVE